MQNEFAITLQTALNPADMGVIIRGLTEYNASKANGDTPDYLVLTVRDKQQNIVGGLVGATYPGWLQRCHFTKSSVIRSRAGSPTFLQAARGMH